MSMPTEQVKLLTRDVAAAWYRARAQLGLDNNISIGVQNSAGCMSHWFEFSHERFDGVGAIRHLLRSFGVTDWQEPRSSEQPPPPQETPALRAHGRPQRLIIPRGTALDTPRQVSACTLDADVTQQLISHLRTRCMRVSTALLFAINQVVAEHCVHLASPASWFFPISMRGSMRLPRDDQNHTSGFYLALPPNMRVEDLQDAVDQALAAGEHWRLWRQADLVAGLGDFAVRQCLRYLLNHRQHTGSLTWLGQWQANLHGTPVSDAASLVICGPGSLNHPVANGALVFNGCLSLALRLDPVLGTTAAQQAQWLQGWKRHLLALGGL